MFDAAWSSFNRKAENSHGSGIIMIFPYFFLFSYSSSIQEIVRISRLFVEHGVDKIRLTGGRIAYIDIFTTT